MNTVLSEGIGLYNQKKYSAALAFFLTVTDDEPAVHEELVYYTGLCYARLQRHDEAVEYLEQIVTAGNNTERVNQCRLVLAVIYSMTGRIRLADFELKKLLEDGCQTASVYAALAYVAWEQKNEDVSVQYYEKALEIDAENPTALNGLGYVLACTGRDLMRALSLCKKAVDAVPESAAFLDSLGWVYYKIGLGKEAASYIHRARSKDTSNSTEIAEHYKAVSGGVSGFERTGRGSGSGRSSRT